MKEEQIMLIDIIKNVPDNSFCFINAPVINDTSAILKLLSPANNYNWVIRLTGDNKQKLIDVIISESIQDCFHRLDIIHNNSVLCESYDAMRSVILSTTLNSRNKDN